MRTTIVIVLFALLEMLSVYWGVELPIDVHSWVKGGLIVLAFVQDIDSLK